MALCPVVEFQFDSPVVNQIKNLEFTTGFCPVENFGFVSKNNTGNSKLL